MRAGWGGGGVEVWVGEGGGPCQFTRQKHGLRQLLTTLTNQAPTPVVVSQRASEPAAMPTRLLLVPTLWSVSGGEWSVLIATLCTGTWTDTARRSPNSTWPSSASQVSTVTSNLLAIFRRPFTLGYETYSPPLLTPITECTLSCQNVPHFFSLSRQWSHLLVVTCDLLQWPRYSARGR